MAAPAAAAGGTTGSLTWDLTDGTLTISGSGAMPNYTYSTVPWKLSRNSITGVVIGNGVTSIGNYAFYGCSGLTSITFAGGSKLTGIGSNAFYGCSLLNFIEIPTGVTGIGSFAFDGCSSLTYINIPAGVTSIGTSIFNGCSGLTSITVDEENTKYKDIDGVLFSKDGAQLYTYPIGNSSTSYEIPSGVTSISSFAFSKCSFLTSIGIPSSVISIGTYAFDGCCNLTSIDLPSGVTGIGTYVFNNCRCLTSIEIPSGVTYIGESAFNGCSSLTSVIFADDSQLTRIDWGAFRECSCLTSIDLPSGVTSISTYAFSECSCITSIEIPSVVTFIGNYAFSDCSNLTSVTFAESSQLTSIASYVFGGCSSLTFINIPSGVTSIDSSAFNGCSSLTSIVIPSNVTSIGDGAFDDLSANSIVYCTDVSLLSGKYSADKTALAVNNTDGSYTFASDVTNLALSAANAPSGITYVGWFEESTFTTPVTSIAAGTNPTLWLKRSAPAEIYTITITSAAGGSASASAESAVAGTLVILTAVPNTGYKLKEWQVVSGGVAVVNNQFTMPACDVEINAVFEKILISANKSASIVNQTTPENLSNLSVPLFTNLKSGKSIPLNDSVVVKAVIGGVEQPLPAKIVDNQVVLDDPGSAAGADSLTVEFIGRKLGDSDGDGNVTVNDAVRVAQSLVKIVTLDDKGEFYGDADSDGNITVNDAVKVAQRLVGLVDENYE